MKIARCASTPTNWAFRASLKSKHHHLPHNNHLHSHRCLLGKMWRMRCGSRPASASHSPPAQTPARGRARKPLIRINSKWLTVIDKLSTLKLQTTMNVKRRLVSIKQRKTQRNLRLKTVSVVETKWKRTFAKLNTKIAQKQLKILSRMRKYWLKITKPALFYESSCSDRRKT